MRIAYLGPAGTFSEEAALLYAYRSVPIPDRFRLDDESCVVMPMRYLSPSFRIANNDGYTKPDEWFGFLAWAVSLRRNGADGYWVSKQVSVRSGSKGGSYFVRGPEERQAAQLKDALRRLDQDAFATPSGTPGPLEIWFERTSPSVANVAPRRSP